MKTIIKYSFKEMLAKKTFFITIILTLGFLFLYGYGVKEFYKSILHISHPMKDIFIYSQSSFIMTAGYYFANMLTAFLVIFAASGIISWDIENQTIYTIISKPIKRYEYVLGRFIGIGTMVFIYSILVFFAILIINKIFGSPLAFGWDVLLKSSFLFGLEAILLLTVATFASSIFSTINTGIILTMLFGFALIGGFLEQIGNILILSGQNGQTLVLTGIISSLIMPTDTIYRKMSQLMFTTGSVSLIDLNPFSTISAPSIWMMIYWALYGSVMLFMALRNFSKRDI